MNTKMIIKWKFLVHISINLNIRSELTKPDTSQGFAHPFQEPPA